MWIALILACVAVVVLLFLRHRREFAKPPSESPLRTIAPEYSAEVRLVAAREMLFLERPRFRATLDLPSAGIAVFTAQPRGRFSGTLHVCSDRLGGLLGKMFAGEDLEIGDAEFDALYLIKGASHDFAERVLTPENRALFRALGRAGDAILTLSPVLFKIRIRGAAGRNEIDRLLSCGLQIADSLPQVEEGMVVIETSVQVTGTSCQVCGAPLLQNLVGCTKCAALHHAECWEFNGRCATFACGSIESRKAELKER